eukprot:CAMPEP_0198333212 /NCGR_PEP_ID=MMETSP1450-20131203/18812_1 /TAXON_ID=753684 ORGANISM="Madagascaria erythrocladiodes, Strain CCMP3234" /NCGR_SAMPLE_ID=MMETSP1450 /ASSEMBLY_ACC=CAM_ASM_001115 /LENGTH=86 /DNA_ID=CAMNT_0044037721 /DNA_START=197 /DNA_END=454 /DNA_ORIENTATION=+
MVRPRLGGWLACAFAASVVGAHVARADDALLPFDAPSTVLAHARAMCVGVERLGLAHAFAATRGAAAQQRARRTHAVARRIRPPCP